MKKLIVTGIVLLQLATPLVVFAEDSTTAVTPTTVETTTAPTSDSTTVSPTKATSNLRTKVLLRPTIVQNRKALEERIKQERETFKTKVATLKDERKKTIVTNIDERISTVNANRTQTMQEALTKMQTYLSRVASKTSELKAKGADTASVDSAVTAANNAITTAQAAVQTQANKSYTITITSEANIKNNVGATLKQLNIDLLATHETVKAARTAVENVFKVIKTVKIGTHEKGDTASSSAK